MFHPRRLPQLPSPRLPMCLVVSALLFALLANAPRVVAQEVEVAVTDIQIGFEGAYRVGKWTPVWVAVQAEAGEFDGMVAITTPDGDGTPATYRAPATVVSDTASNDDTANTTRHLIYVKFGRTTTWLDVELRSSDKGLLARRRYSAGTFPAPRPVSRELVLTLGGEAGVAEAAALSRRKGEDAYLPCSQSEPSLLPNDWFGYESIDTAVLIVSNSGYLESWKPAQVKALLQWVDQGGTLIVSRGAALPESWQALYPFGLPESQTLRRTTALEVFAGATQRLDLVAESTFQLPVSPLAELQGRSLLSESIAGERQSLFLLAPRGFGVVLYSALDLTTEPIAAWRDRPRLVLRLLRMGSENEALPSDAPHSGGRVTHIGYQDLSGQLRAALEAFTFGGISLIPFSWVAGLIVLYILLIGPVDYYFLRRVVGRMEFTWLSFPVVALLLATGAIALTSIYKGDALEARQLAVWDYDLSQGIERRTNWAHIYSPANARYSIGDASSLNSLTSWHGLPGTALGGMQNTASSVGQEARYELAVSQPGEPWSLQAVDTPINAWATKSMVLQSWSASDPAQFTGASQQTSLRETYDQRLSGHVNNATKFKLTNAKLLYDRWVYAIRGTVEPGERIILADEAPPRDLEWNMTRRVVNDENKPVSAPWNPSELDLTRIAEMLMFHRAAGGVGYTELANRHLPWLDLSRHLQLGRAVLVGQVESPAGMLTIDSQPLAPTSAATTMYVRLVIPVDRSQ